MPELGEIADEDLYRSWHNIGNSDALSVLVEKWRLILPRFFVANELPCSEADAKDLTQEVLIIMWRNNSYRGEGEFRYWVYRIAKNKHIDLCRKKKYKKEVNLSQYQVEKVTEEVGEDYKIIEALDELMCFLNNYPHTKKRDVLLRHISGRSIESISEEFHVSTATVGQYISCVKNDVSRHFKGK